VRLGNAAYFFVSSSSVSREARLQGWRRQKPRPERRPRMPGATSRDDDLIGPGEVCGRPRFQQSRHSGRMPEPSAMDGRAARSI
jgi:hypothetical protein